MHKTEAGERRKELLIDISDLKRDVRALEKIAGMDEEIAARREKLAELEAEAKELKLTARAEDLQVWRGFRTSRAKTGKCYTGEYWHACWRVGGRSKNIQLGSCRKMSYEEALAKACRMKREMLRGGQ